MQNKNFNIEFHRIVKRKNNSSSIIISSITVTIASKRRRSVSVIRVILDRLFQIPRLRKKPNRSGHFLNLSNFRPSMDREPSDVPQVGEHNTRRRGGGERREGEGRQPQRHAAQPCVLHQKCCEQTLLRPYFTLGWANVPLTKLIPRQSLCTFEDFWVKLAALPRRALLPSYFLFHFLGNARVARKRHFSPFLPSPSPPLPRPAPRYTAPSPPLLNRRRCNNSSPRLSPVNQHIATRLCVPFRSIFHSLPFVLSSFFDSR